jgi:hypothetical protein
MPARLQKTTLLICFCFTILFIGRVKSQSITLYGGPGLPVGQYGGKDFPLSENGFAKAGFHAGLIYDLKTKSNLFNMYGSIIYNKNKVDYDAFNRSILFRNIDVRSVQILKSWNQGALIFGSKLKYSNQHYELFGKLGLGIAWLGSPGYNLNYDTTTGIIIKWKSSTVVTGLVQAGIGANIHLNPGISLFTGVDLLYGRPDYGTIKFTDTNGNPVSTSLENLKVPLTIIQFSMGLRFNILKPEITNLKARRPVK